MFDYEVNDHEGSGVTATTATLRSEDVVYIVAFRPCYDDATPFAFRWTEDTSCVSMEAT